MFAMTIGEPDESNEVKPRLPVEAIIHENGYDAINTKHSSPHTMTH